MAAKGNSAPRERFINRYRGRITSGAAGAVAYESFNTGMNVGRADPFKWIILGFGVKPNLAANMATFHGTELALGNYSSWQLCIGTQTDLLNGDDMQVVCELGWGFLRSTSGSSIQEFPIWAKLPGPLPVFAQTLTVVEDHFNGANLNSLEWTYEIDYVAAPIAQDELVEYLSAFGQV